MPHHDDKGRISPAQSKTARQMRSTPLSERTMGQMGDKGYGGNIHGRHAYGRTHVGVGGMASMAKAREANKGKRAKSRVVLRGQKSAVHKSDVKAERAEHKFKRAMAEVRGGIHNDRKAIHGYGTPKHDRSKLKVIARGKNDEKRKAYTKVGARFHKKGLLHVPKVEI